MTLACKWVNDRTGTGRLVMKWAKEDLSEQRRGESDHNLRW
jgi:hypothetical protein